ncbi:trifunctional nucleotide phosphoesterase protein YfkN-like protein [Leptotrombidium deliense]|uniref:Trifunctional nucleotide phosphoesterase protein YfkN-like protein n=1 Tax=Leptotrombidium deliense TaxID=299467 RepID=A0A443SA40_9ACAR|nr:trifunctional nucleotide phosphoesterase protein YfkN-like protein [Leptotrombidium deliense]
MRFPNDCRLAENVDEIDLILGGHDHVYEVKKVNDKYIVKSGTDFRQLSKISVTFNDQLFNVKIEEINITSKDFGEDETLKREMQKYSTNIEQKMDIVLGHFNCDLDGRFSSIRTQETNLGNFIADIMLSSTHSDLAILNSGTLRSDRIHLKGEFKLRDLVAIMPAIDPMVVLSVTGEQILKALENGVSQWPKLEGRFPQVSGVQFCFDAEKPCGSRVDPRFVKIGDEYLDLNQNYRLVTKEYLHQGKDGYEVFKDCEVLLSEEECPELCTSIQNHFEAIKILTNSSKYQTHHRQSLVCVSRRHSIVKMHEMGSSLGIEPTTIVTTQASSRNYKKSISLENRKSLVGNRRLSIDDIEHEQCKLEPKVEGRIILINDQILNHLEAERKKITEHALEEVIPEEPEDQ